MILSQNGIGKGERQLVEGEPIRNSLVILVLRVFLLMFLVDTLYSVITYFSFRLNLFQDAHYFLVIVLSITHIIKNLFEIYMVLSIILTWVGNTYIITGSHIIERRGILNMREQMFDLKNIRSASIEQGWMGKLFHYGDVMIQTSASGGYNEKINLTGISHPEKYGAILKRFINEAS